MMMIMIIIIIIFVVIKIIISLKSSSLDNLRSEVKPEHTRWRHLKVLPHLRFDGQLLSSRHSDQMSQIHKSLG